MELLTVIDLAMAVNLASSPLATLEHLHHLHHLHHLLHPQATPVPGSRTKPQATSGEVHPTLISHASLVSAQYPRLGISRCTHVRHARETSREKHAENTRHERWHGARDVHAWMDESASLSAHVGVRMCP